MVAILISLSVVLIMSFFLGLVSKRIGLTSIFGQIAAGIVLGLPIIRAFLFGSESLAALDVLSTLGIVFLLFLAGLEIDWEKMKETTKDSVLVALGTTLIPLVVGLSLLLSLGYNLIVAFVFGGALAVTAGGTIVGILMDHNVCNTKLGAIFVSAGTIDDILEILLLGTMVMLFHGGDPLRMALLPVELCLFVGVAYLIFRAVTKILPQLRLHTNGGGNVELFSIAIIIMIGMAALSEALEVGYLVGALISGFLLQNSIKKLGKQREAEILNATRLVSLAFIVPFFFVNIGLSFDLSFLLGNPLLTIGATVAAIGGSIAGALVTKPFSSLSTRQLYLVGWAMSSKGSVEMVIALLAMKYGLLPPEVFSAIVAMAMITTIVFPFVFKRELEKNRSIMVA